MARQNIDIGVQGNDGTGDSIRESFRKVNENFIQLFSIFGAGDTIGFKDLDDTPRPTVEKPNGYGPDQVIVGNTEGDSLLAKNLVGGEGIAVDHSDENEIRIISTGGKVGNDIKPQLGGHLNAAQFSIGNLAEPTDETAESFNNLHDTNITADDLVITKGFADQRYLQANGGPGTGSQVRVRDEPASIAEYTITIDAWNSGFAQIPDHGFNSGSNGIAFRYEITGSQPATNLTPNTVYYLRYVDKNRMSIHATREDAVSGDSRIIVNDPPVVPPTAPGVETLVDANYDPTLEGRWVSNEALPRKSVVRRQGDSMEGALMLHDHPGSFAGLGSPNGADDLQAATKFYVDSSSFASQTNLFVATSGTDDQDNIPLDKRGRAFAYAYASINAACQRAEEIINNSRLEPGPYRQVLTYDGGTNNCYLNSFSTISGAERELVVYSTVLGVDQSKDPTNRDLREGSIIRGLRSGATGKVLTYVGITAPNTIYHIELLHKKTDIVYFQTDYFNAADKVANNRDFIAAEVTEYMKAKYPSVDFDEEKSRRDTGLLVDALEYDLRYGGNAKSIKAARTYWRGTTSVLPGAQKAVCVDGINYLNLLAQQIITNTTIPAVTLPDTFLVRRRSAETQDISGLTGETGSGALITLLIGTIAEIVQYGIEGNPAVNSYIEFLPNEILEFGQLVPEAQVTIRVETGVYYEQLPIRVPTNVSIKGDEFRRVIIRPAPGISTSPWAGIYFYRDSEFDGLRRSYDLTPASSSGTTITVADTEDLEADMAVFVTGGTGSLPAGTKIVSVLNATEFTINKTPTVALAGASIRVLNNSGLAPDGVNFGYHYLTDPENPESANNLPKDNKYMDVFLMNDGTILRNITCQGHGGFMCVLDPEGQIQTKSPYMQTCTSLSGSLNKQAFRGGQYIDGFSGNLPARIVGKNSTTELLLDGLDIRAPGIPTSFIISGVRYQINEVDNYNQGAGTATITLSDSTPYTAPYTAPLNIIIQTPGNRSMLSNDFTQVNDLGYGIVANNNAVTELVSMFTYYNWTSYFANNGAQIRSTTGSSCNGTYGIRARGSDPNEVPDVVSLGDDTVLVAKVYKRNTLASKSVEGDISLYIDNYKFIPYNVSELEIDYTPNKVSLIPDNPAASITNITVVNPGLGYAVGDTFEAVGGTLYDTGSTKTTLRVKSITGGGPTGPIDEVEPIDVGEYKGGLSPVGAGTTGTFTTSTLTGAGSGAIIGATYLGDIVTYTVNTIEKLNDVTDGVKITPGGIPTSVNVLKLNLATSQTGTTGQGVALAAALEDGQTVILRGRRQFRFTGVANTEPTRPSTSLTFTDTYEDFTSYNTINYNTTYSTGGSLPANEAILEFNNGFETVLLQADPSKLTGGYGSAAGDTKIAIQVIPTISINRLNSGNMIFGWKGRLHRVTSYVAASGPIPAHIVFVNIGYGDGSVIPASPGLAEGLPLARATNLRAGLPEGSPAEITVNISTCRCSGHDFLDIGTGGYNTTNYPNNVFGSPALPPAQEQEVVEENGGRVYYMSTDQSGIFRVGRYFSVDQGTGTVSFSASIALSDLDGLGFKRGGSVVKEFSTDTGMADNDPYSATTEYAVREYVGRRLGIDHDGNPIDPALRIPNNSGFLPVNSVGASDPTMLATLNMDGNFIIAVHDPVDPGDAANKDYVDTQIESRDSFYKLKEVNVMTPAAGDVVMFTGADKTVISGSIGGDVSSTFTSTASTTLIGGRSTAVITDSGIIGATNTSVTYGIELDDASGFVNPGSLYTAYILIDDEILGYTEISGNILENITRANFTTVGAVHSAGATVLGLDSSFIDLQIKPDTIVNADVKSDAGILQSKLELTLATTRAAAPTGTAAQKQAASGLASFDEDNFEITDGFVGIKSGGVALSEIQTISANTIVANLTGSTANPSAVPVGDLVESGVNNLFTNIDAGATVMTRRYSSLKTGAGGTTFNINPSSVAIAGTGLFTNIPVTTVTGNGNGAKVSVGYGGGVYTGVVVSYGGQGYAEGDQLLIKGSLLGGADPTNDLSFTIETTTGGTNIDSDVYLGLQRVSQIAEADAIVKTDSSRNLGNSGNKFNTVHATTFAGNATTASTATNIAGGVTGSIPYQSATGTTTLLGPGTSGRYLKTQGAGNPPVWSEIVIPDGDAGSLTGTTLASNVVNSSLTSVGTLTGLTVDGLVAVSVNNNVGATGNDQGTATLLTANINIVRTAAAGTPGVRLPVAVAGYKIIIRNNTAGNILVYPNTDAFIGIGAPNDPVVSEPSTALEYFCVASAVGGVGGEWYTLNATYA